MLVAFMIGSKWRLDLANMLANGLEVDETVRRLMTLERILLVTLGKGILFLTQSSPIMCSIVCDSNATTSSTLNAFPSKLFSVIFLCVDILVDQSNTLFYLIINWIKFNFNFDSVSPLSQGYRWAYFSKVKRRSDFFLSF